MTTSAQTRGILGCIPLSVTAVQEVQDQEGSSRPKRNPWPGVWVGLGSAFAFANFLIQATDRLVPIAVVTMLVIGFTVFVPGAVLGWRTRSRFELLTAASIFTGLTNALLAWDMSLGTFDYNLAMEFVVAITGPLCFIVHLLWMPFAKAPVLAGYSRDPSPGLWVGLGWAFASASSSELRFGNLPLGERLSMFALGFAVFVRGAILCWRVRTRFGFLAAASVFTGLTYALSAWDFVGGHSDYDTEMLLGGMGPLCFLAHLLTLPFLKGEARVRESPHGQLTLWVGVGWFVTLINISVLSATRSLWDRDLWDFFVGVAISVSGAILSWRVRSRFRLLTTSSILSVLTYALFWRDLTEDDLGSNAKVQIVAAVAGIVCYAAHLWGTTIRKEPDKVRESPDTGPTEWVGLGWLIALYTINVLWKSWYEMDHFLGLLGIGIAAFIWGAILSWRVRRRFRLLTAASILSGLTYALLWWDIHVYHFWSHAALETGVAVTGLLCYIAHLLGAAIRKGRSADLDQSPPSAPVPQR